MRTNYETLTKEYEPIIASHAYCNLGNFEQDEFSAGLSNIPILANKSTDTIFTDSPFANQPVANMKLFSGTPLTQSDDIPIYSFFYVIRRSVKNYGDVLAENLMTLFNFSKEEDPYDIGISYESLYNFICFLKLHSNIKRPVVTLTPEKNIYASWRASNKRLFSAHFLTNGDVRFVLFKPNDKHPNRMSRFSGIESVDMLYEVISPYQLKGWITYEG